MSSKELLNQLSSMQLENCLTCPIDDLPHLDNSDTLNFIRRQKFQMKSSLNKLKNELSQKEVSEDTRSKIDDLLNLTLEQLRSLLEQKVLGFNSET